MRELLLDILRFTVRFLTSILLWAYAALAAFVWHFARHTPDWAVLLRVSASLLSDLVWIPFGIITWTAAIRILFAVSMKHGTAPGVFPVAAFVAAFHILFPDIAFTFLFIPLAVTVPMVTFRMVSGRKGAPGPGYLLPLAAAALLVVAHYRTQMIPLPAPRPQGKTVTVMSWNIFCNAGPEDRMKVVETIRKESPDVLCCIEFNFVTDLALIDRELRAMYPYSLAGSGPGRTRSGAMIYSKYPVERKAPSSTGTWRNRWEGRITVLFAELRMDDGPVNLVMYHLKSVGHYIEYIADKKFTLREKIVWAATHEEGNDRDKFSQAKALVETVSSFSGRTIICGDLNDTPNSRAFHLLSASYRNTFSERGWGLGATFGGVRISEKLGGSPLASLIAGDVLRIDHIFAGKGMRVISSRVVTGARGSDHKPVTSVLSME